MRAEACTPSYRTVAENRSIRGPFADPYLALTSCRVLTEGVSHVTHHGLPLGHPEAADFPPANERRGFRLDNLVIRADARKAHRRRRKPATVAAAEAPRLGGRETAIERPTSVERKTPTGKPVGVLFFGAGDVGGTAACGFAYRRVLSCEAATGKQEGRTCGGSPLCVS